MSVLDNHIFYDILICGFLAADGFLIGLIIKRSGLLCVSAIVAAIIWLVIFYGSFIEPNLLIVNNQNIKLRADAAANLKIAFVSDIHAGPYKKTGFVERVVNTTNDLKPDMVILGGDFVYNSAEQTEFLGPLKNLRAPLGIFAVLGNHDYGEEKIAGLVDVESGRAEKISSVLRSFGIQVLINEGRKIKIGDKTLTLLGVDDYWSNPDLEAALILTQGNIVPVYPTILISHNPDIVIDNKNYGINLVLAAHTHGGQVRLPFIGPVPHLPDHLGRQYDRGLFEIGTTKLFITSGAGEIGARARLFDPPEIALLNISS